MPTKSTTSNPALKVANILKMFRALSGDMQMQQADVLLNVALSPGLTMNDLAQRTGLSQSSVSRNVLALCKFQKLGVPGFGLVEAVTDPRETRRRVVFLTTEGKTFITKLLRNIDPSYSIDKDTDARVEVERMHEEAMSAKNGK